MAALDRGALIAPVIVALAFAQPCCAQDMGTGSVVNQPPIPPAQGPPAAAGDSAGLAKQLANPIASLISVPFQLNTDFGIGPGHDGTRAVLNIQPVIPFSIGADANLISRTIVPVVYQDSKVAGNATLGAKFGIGDIVQSVFFSPKRPTSSGIVWGAGPVLLLPTATDTLLGSGKWGIGPALVVLKQDHGFTYGALVDHIWSIAGKQNRAPVSQTLLQPFLNYTWPSAVTLGLSSEAVYNWKSERWTVPVNLAVSKIVKLGQQPASIQAGVRYYVERPDGGPRWGMRLTLTLLFPKHPA